MWNRTVTSTFNLPGVKLTCGNVPNGCEIALTYCIDVTAADGMDSNHVAFEVTDFTEAADGTVTLGKTRLVSMPLL